MFVLQDDRTVKQRNVVRGQPVGDRVQVASGLQVGERVITEGAGRLRDGARVALAANGRRQPAPAGAGAMALAPAAPAASGRSRPLPSRSWCSAAAAPAAPQREATATWAGASALMGAPGAAAARAAEQQQLTPEQRGAPAPRRQEAGAQPQ